VPLPGLERNMTATSRYNSGNCNGLVHDGQILILKTITEKFQMTP